MKPFLPNLQQIRLLQAAGLLLAISGAARALLLPPDAPAPAGLFNLNLPGLWLHLIGLCFLLAGRAASNREKAKAILDAAPPEVVELPHDRYVEPELWDAPPRRTRVRTLFALRRFRSWLVLLLAFAAFFALSGRDLSRRYFLARNGKPATAQVTGRIRLDPKERKGRVYYAFRTEQAVVTSSFDAPRADYSKFPTGAAFPVRYLPTDPGIHTWRAADTANMTRPLALWGTVGILLFVYLGLPVLSIERALRRQQRLARWGTATTGLIIAAIPILRLRRTVAYHIVYQFRDANETPQAGTDRVEAYRATRLPVGTSVTVLYAPTAPETSRLYLGLSAVRVPLRDDEETPAA